MTKNHKQPFEIHLKTPDGEQRTVKLGDIDLVTILAKKVSLGIFKDGLSLTEKEAQQVAVALKMLAEMFEKTTPEQIQKGFDRSKKGAP
jgi:hypothetical protein